MVNILAQVLFLVDSLKQFKQVIMKVGNLVDSLKELSTRTYVYTYMRARTHALTMDKHTT